MIMATREGLEFANESLLKNRLENRSIDLTARSYLHDQTATKDAAFSQCYHAAASPSCIGNQRVNCDSFFGDSF